MATASIIFDLIGRDRASGPIDKVGDSADKSGGKMAKFGKMAKVAALGLAAGAGAAAVGMFKLAQGAAEDAAGQARLAKALQNSTGATKAQVAGVEDWISKQGLALGVADDQLRPALEKLAVATGDVGKAQKLASLAMDISAGTGMSLEMVSKALAKAQNGQVSGLTRLGISTKDAEGKTISFRESMKRLADAHKGQAATAAGTLQGKMDRLKLVLAETGETIGATVLPIATKLADWFLRKGVPAISAFGDYLGTMLPPIFERVKAVVSTVLGALRGDVSKNMGGIREIFRNVVSIIQSLWGAFGGTLVQFLRSTFQNLKTILSGAFTVIRGIFKTVSALLKGDWKGVWNGIKLILRGAVTLLTGVVRQLWAALKGAFKLGGTALKAVFKAAWEGIKSLARSAASSLVEGIRGIPAKILGLHRSFASAGKNLLQAFLNGMKNAGGFIAGIASNVWEAVKKLLNSGIDKINSALEFTIKGPGPLPDVHVNPPNIPHLAKGGIVNRPTLALIGEAGPEAVVPLRGRNAPQVVASGGGGVTVHVHGFVGSERQLAKELERVLVVGQRSTGRAYQFSAAGA
ncbi:phage tail protein [Nocardioides sp. J54]|uniref:phage tail protein n=1 Tax=Nocardioides sp. J54 TaxID=935866 RepID=UPI000491D44A|nr:hypothetical protein [Nocardioides sp. J54]